MVCINADKTLGCVTIQGDVSLDMSGSTLVLKSNGIPFGAVATSNSYLDLINKPSIPAAQANADWNSGSGVTQILNKPIVVSAFANDAGYVDATALATKQNLLTTGTTAQYFRGDLSLATFPAIPSTARTTSTLSLSLVGTGATGTQISATKDSTVRCTVSTSTTSTIGGPATSVVALKICATNNVTEGSWTTVGTIESDQTITLAIVLQSIQIVKGQICADVPAGWFVKLVNSGTGTHAEVSVSGQQTIYG